MPFSPLLLFLVFFLMAGPRGLGSILQNGNPSKWKSSLPLTAAPECHRGDEREPKATLLPMAAWGKTELMGGRRHQGGVFRGNLRGFPSSSLGSSWKGEKQLRDTRTVTFSRTCRQRHPWRHKALENQERLCRPGLGLASPPAGEMLNNFGGL